jgi:hypothetical protein
VVFAMIVVDLRVRPSSSTGIGFLTERPCQPAARDSRAVAADLGQPLAERRQRNEISIRFDSELPQPRRQSLGAEVGGLGALFGGLGA